MKRRDAEGAHLIDGVAQILARMDDPRVVADFLEDLCTPAELEAIADRWSVVPPLSEGVSYRQVHALTGVSVTTIGRVARYFATGAGGYEKALEIYRNCNGDSD